MSLALKYRPTSFDTLIGQESISQTLSLALDTNRLTYAYLFSGLRGSGKTSTARIFAKSLLCDKGPTSSPCGECENCIASSSNSHIDIIEIDGASNRKIDDVRDLIEQTKYRPNMGRFKIYIIDEVHMLTKEAFNALLKTLEEPPEYVKFILATTDPLKVPITILSRTQHFRFKKIKKEDIVRHISYILNRENVDYEMEALEMVARIGGGSLRDTITMIEQAIIYSKGKINSKSIASMYGLIDPEILDTLFDKIFKKEKKEILKIIDEIENFDSEVVIDELINYIKEKFFSGDKRFSLLVSERFFKIVSEAKELLFLNADNGFIFTIIFFKMVEALNIKSVDEMIKSLEKEIKPHFEIVSFNEKEESKPKENGKELFQQLIEKIYQKDYNLGECFSKHIKFISFKNGELTWESCADNECKKLLRTSYSKIKYLIQEIYGIHTKISMLPCREEKKEEKIEKELEMEEKRANSNHSSMVEEVTKIEESEVNPEDLVNSPFVQKAISLFEVDKIKIKSKV